MKLSTQIQFGHLIVILLTIILFFVIGCRSTEEYKPSSPPKPVYFSKNWKAAIGFPHYQECFVYRNNQGNLVASIAVETGFLQSFSSDNGITWSMPEKIPGINLPFNYPIYSGGKLIGVFIQKKAQNGGQLYFHIYKDGSLMNAAPIRDTHWGDFGLGTVAIDSSHNYYCCFIDWREGNPDVYFSASFDSGATWRPNIRINDDQSGQEQTYSMLLSSAGGMLCAIWVDNRNPKTLFDIYCSTSADRGETWSPNIKINDDTTHTWQGAPSAIIDKVGNLYVAWYDYRDVGVSGDIIANIYFARSTNGGNSWSKNVRISHSQYENVYLPKLVIGTNNVLYCTWESYDNRNRADIYFAYSIDLGQTWSQPTKVNDEQERFHHKSVYGGALPDSEGNVVIGWLDWREREPTFYMAKMLYQPDSSRSKGFIQVEEKYSGKKLSIEYHSSQNIFQDNFRYAPSKKWQEQSGFWIGKDGMYIGYWLAQSYIQIEPMNSYEFSGQFLLDQLNHDVALLLFQPCEHGSGNYRLTNRFRAGVSLEYFDGCSFVPVIAAPYPFKSNTWYHFRAVVKENSMNYFVNDSLILVTEKLHSYSYEKLGIGSGVPPTYFKDIKISKIE